MHLKLCKAHNNGQGAMLPIDQFYPKVGNCKECDKERKRLSHYKQFGITEEAKQFQRLLTQRWRYNDEIRITDNLSYYGHWD